MLDGYNPIDKAIARIKELGQTACAITDHGHMGGAPVFIEECKKQGVKPILGVEAYWNWSRIETVKPVEERHKDAYKKAVKAGDLPSGLEKLTKAQKELIAPYEHDTRQYHVILLAMNQKGWGNLVKMISRAANESTFNGRFLVDNKLMKEYNEGIICLTACIASAPASLVLKRKNEEAEKLLLEWREIFGDRLYLEIQPLDIPQQRAVNLFYLEMSEKHSIQCAATNDVHYARKGDHDDHDTFLCIGTGKKKDEEERMRYTNDFWIKSEEEMTASFQAQTDSIFDEFPDGDREKYESMWKEAIKNTEKIANHIDDNIKLGSDKPLFPKVEVPHGMSPEDYLSMLSWKGLYEYLSKHPECNRKVYEQRVADELDVINPKGFAPYMLAVREYTTWSEKNGIAVGPGRGSAAGSLVLFLVGVTRCTDPIKYDLMFGRFLTKDRKSPPDWKRVVMQRVHSRVTSKDVA